jgi:hypothetical protein
MLSLISVNSRTYFVFSDSYELHIIGRVKTHSSSHDYTYLPLEDGISIRLLHVEPAKDPESPVQAILLHPSISEQSPYEASSYTWGEPEFTHDVYLLQGRLKIIENLHSALR